MAMVFGVDLRHKRRGRRDGFRSSQCLLSWESRRGLYRSRLFRTNLNFGSKTSRRISVISFQLSTLDQSFVSDLLFGLGSYLLPYVIVFGGKNSMDILAESNQNICQYIFTDLFMVWIRGSTTVI